MKISFIIPCYNEEQDISKKCQQMVSFFVENNIDYELILVNDGSKDNTSTVINSIKEAVAVNYEPNHGKGYAVKQGINAASGDYVFIMDADLSTDLSCILEFLPLLPQYDMVIGSRHMKESVVPIKQPLKRRFISLCCHILVNTYFGFKYHDTQCGFKAIKTDIAKQIAQRQIIEGFAFDVEYLYFMKLNHHTVLEKPVIWRDDRGSTVKKGASKSFMKEMKIIKKNKKNYIYEK